MSYRIHVPRAGAVTCLPDDYETIDEAVLAFELDPGEVGWCFINRTEKADPRHSPFVLRGCVENARVKWQPVK